MLYVLFYFTSVLKFVKFLEDKFMLHKKILENNFLSFQISI